MARKPRAADSYLSARTRATIEKAMGPVIQELQQRKITCSTEPIRCSIELELDLDDVPGMFDYIVNTCQDTIIKTALTGDAMGQGGGTGKPS